ncbi:MAG: hypothetical protein Q8P62_04265 [Candidatus Peregrinibacteria bacterium]|nr:hypothetical protein [Candidatus Peregrinibacteria bacterium]
MKSFFKNVSVFVILVLCFSFAGEIIFQNNVDALSGGPDTYGYEYRDTSEFGVSYSWNDISATGTSVGTRGDESVYGSFSVGFDFVFYGNTYNEFYICNNGYIAFNNTCAYSNADIITAATPNNYIAPFWDDLYLSTDIVYLSEGSSPAKTLTVSWLDVNHWNAQGGYIKFQVILYETSNGIKFQYNDVAFENASYDGGASATVGIENSDGTDGLKFSYNTSSLSASYAIQITLDPEYDQSAYGLFVNADSTDVGSALAAQDTAYSLTSAGQEFRLRMLLHVSVNNLVLDDGSFKLQFIGRGTGSCSSPSGGTPATWTDVTTSTAIAYNDNATPTDASVLTSNVNDPTHSTDTIVNQTYEEENNFSNSEGAVLLGQDGKWDFSLFDYQAIPGATYCVKIVKSFGSDLDTYSVYPEITIYGGPDTYGYVYRNTTYGWNDISSGSGTPGTSVGTLGDDTLYGAFSVGFDFDFYGNTYSQFYICNNGYVTFTNATCDYSNTTIPTASDPDNFIAVMWDDFYYTQGEIRYLSQGTVPNRTLTVSYLDVKTLNSPNGGTFQVILSESDDSIILQYQDSTFGGAGYDYGIIATIGIENSDGSDGLQRGYNQAVVSDEYAVSFYMLPTYTQSAYRFFENADTASVFSALAAQDTSFSLASQGEAFRLRMLVHVGGSDISGSEFTGKLQYVGKGSGTCSSPSGGTPSSWTDITGGTDLAYKDNATPVDGDSLTLNGNDPTHSTDTVQTQTYEESNNFTNSVAGIGVGEDGEWDFALYDYSLIDGDTYCIRAVESDGTIFSSYDSYPEFDAYSSDSLTFSISDIEVGLGELSYLAAKYATGDALGSYDSTSAHTLTVASTGTYSVTVQGATLTSGGDTITAITGASAASNPGTEQFGLYLSAAGGGGTVVSDYGTANQFYYAGTSSMPSEVGSCSSSCGTSSVFSVYYLANISSSTESGSYSSAFTYVATGTF